MESPQVITRTEAEEIIFSIKAIPLILAFIAGLLLRL